MKKHEASSDESFSIKTTKTMREKAFVLGRCIINMLKFWRICFRVKKTQKV